MNIIDSLHFNADKPAVHVIKNTEKVKLIAVGLNAQQELSKHKTGVPTLLTVLKGKISFRMEGDIIILSQFDTFDIPINVMHEVEGLANQNTFILLQEKS